MARNPFKDAQSWSDSQSYGKGKGYPQVGFQSQPNYQSQPVFVGGKGGGGPVGWEAAMRVLPRDVVDIRDRVENSDGSKLRFCDDDRCEVITFACNDVGASEAMHKEKLIPVILRANDDYELSRQRALALRAIIPLHASQAVWDEWVKGVHLVNKALKIEDTDPVANTLRARRGTSKGNDQLLRAAADADSGVAALLTQLLQNQLRVEQRSANPTAGRLVHEGSHRVDTTHLLAEQRPMDIAHTLSSLMPDSRPEGRSAVASGATTPRSVVPKRGRDSSSMVGFEFKVQTAFGERMGKVVDADFNASPVKYTVQWLDGSGGSEIVEEPVLRAVVGCKEIINVSPDSKRHAASNVSADDETLAAWHARITQGNSSETMMTGIESARGIID